MVNKNMKMQTIIDITFVFMFLLASDVANGIKCFIGSSLEEHDEIGCYSIECQLGIGSETLKGGYNKTGDLCATQMPQDLCYQLFRDKLILVKSCRICTEDLCNKD